jgi:large subunit ribosomal protein L18
MRAKQTPQQTRKLRIRKKISGTTERPRLSVYRSLKHIYAQVINDADGQTLAHASTLHAELEADLAAIKSGEKTEKKTLAARKVGELIAKKCLEKQIKLVVFDRNGLPYHGRVAAVADGAREGGLQF